MADSGVAAESVSARSTAQPKTFADKIELDDHACTVNACTWAANDLLVCAVDDTGALYLGEVAADGAYTSTQRIAIASPTAFWLASGGVGDAMIALCGVAAPVFLRLNVDLQRRCVGSTTTYSLDAPAACIATAAASNARTNAFVVDALGISRYVIEDVGETASALTTESCRVRLIPLSIRALHSRPDAAPQVADVHTDAATNERVVAMFSSKFDEIKRIVLHSRAEVRYS